MRSIIQLFPFRRVHMGRVSECVVLFSFATQVEIVLDDAAVIHHRYQGLIVTSSHQNGQATLDANLP